MKKTILFLAVGAALITCKPKLEGELGEAFSKVEGLNGTWQITEFSQRDENNPIKEVRDLSSFYIQDGIESTTITFNSSNMTYTAVPGPGKNYIGTEGSWHLDNNEAPTELIFENVTDTLSMLLGSMPRVFDTQLDLELPRFCIDASGVKTETVTYIFQISRQ